MAAVAGYQLHQSGAFSFNLQMVPMVEQVGAVELCQMERHLSLEHSWLEHTQACHSLALQSQRQAPQQRQRREH
jgi:hypothetical protein